MTPEREAERARRIVSGAMFGLTTPMMVDAIVSDLAAAGLLVTPEHDAEVAAEAWDEGFTSGFYTGTSPRWGEGSDASEPDVTNPYKRGE